MTTTSPEEEPLMPFGKHKGETMEVVTRDTQYCAWLVAQDWFPSKFPALHARLVGRAEVGVGQATPTTGATKTRKVPGKKKTAGKTTFAFEKVMVDRLRWTAETSCLQCGGSLRVRRGQIAAVLRGGNEFIGLTCDGCLSPESREHVAKLREQAKAKTF